MTQPDPYSADQYGAAQAPTSSPYLGQPQYGSPSGYYPGVQRGTNPWAITSLVLGLFGTAIFAVITGHVALAQINRSGEQGRGLAIAGLVLGYLEIVLWALFFAAVFGFLAISSSSS